MTWQLHVLTNIPASLTCSDSVSWFVMILFTSRGSSEKLLHSFKNDQVLPLGVTSPFSP